MNNTQYNRMNEYGCFLKPEETASYKVPTKRKKKKLFKPKMQTLPAEFTTYEPCVHLHFKTELVDRDCLTKEQYFDMLATPKGYRWLGEANCQNPNLDINKKKKKKKVKKIMLIQEKPKTSHEAGDFANDFVEDMWDVMSPEITERLIDFLVNEFGMSAEEAEDFIECKSGIGKQAVCKKKKSKILVGIGPKYKWVKEFSDVFAKRIEQYIIGMLLTKRTPRARRLAEKILEYFCDLTGEKTTLQNPKTKIQKTMVLIADRLAQWIEEILKDTEKTVKKTPSITKEETTDEDGEISDKEKQEDTEKKDEPKTKEKEKDKKEVSKEKKEGKKDDKGDKGKPDTKEKEKPKEDEDKETKDGKVEKDKTEDKETNDDKEEKDKTEDKETNDDKEEKDKTEDKEEKLKDEGNKDDENKDDDKVEPAIEKGSDEEKVDDKDKINEDKEKIDEEQKKKDNVQENKDVDKENKDEEKKKKEEEIEKKDNENKEEEKTGDEKEEDKVQTESEEIAEEKKEDDKTMADANEEQLKDEGETKDDDKIKTEDEEKESSQVKKEEQDDETKKSISKDNEQQDKEDEDIKSKETKIEEIEKQKPPEEETDKPTKVEEKEKQPYDEVLDYLKADITATTKGVKTDRQKAIKEVLEKRLQKVDKGRLPEEDVDDVTSIVAHWMDNVIQSTQQVKPVAIKRGSAFKVKKKTGSTLEVQKLSFDTVAQETAEVRGVEPPPREKRVPKSSSPMNLKSKEEWVDWAERLTSMMEKWGSFMKNTLSETERHLDSKEMSAAKFDWEAWKEKCINDSLKFRAENERMQQDAQIWEKKIDNALRDQTEKQIKSTELSN